MVLSTMEPSYPSTYPQWSIRKDFKLQVCRRAQEGRGPTEKEIETRSPKLRELGCSYDTDQGANGSTVLTTYSALYRGMSHTPQAIHARYNARLYTISH